MISAHTKAIYEGNPIYLTGETIQIPVKGKRSYSIRIKVHKRRSIKPALVKDELRFQSEKARQYRKRIQELMEPRPFKVTTNVKKLIGIFKKIARRKS